MKVAPREADRGVAQLVGKPSPAERLARHGVVVCAVQPALPASIRFQTPTQRGG